MARAKKKPVPAAVAKRVAPVKVATEAAEVPRTEAKSDTAEPAESLLPTTPAGSMVPYSRQCLGMQYPPYLDDCLSRALVKSKVLTGQGDKSVVIDFEPQAAQCAVTGFDVAGLSGSVEVTASYDAAAKTLSIKAPAAVKWSVLVLYQKGTAA